MTPRSSFFWSASGQLISFAINFMGSVLVARLLTPVEMGIYVIGTATVGLIAAFTSLGIGAYIIRAPDLSEETLDTSFTLNAILALSLACVILIIAQLSMPILGSPDAANVLRVLAVTPALGVFTFRPATLLQREGHFKTITLVATSSMLIGTTTTIACAFRGLSYMSPAWGGLASALVTLVGFCVFGARYVRFSFGLIGWRDVLSFGARMITITGAATMTARLADIVMGRMLGLQALGLYSRASNLSNQIFDNVYGTATRVVFVHLAEEYRREGGIKKGFLHAFRIITAVMWPFLIGLAILSPVIVYQLYGDKWSSVALPLSILLIAQAIALFFGMNWELFVIKNETALQTKIELSRSVVGLSVFVIGCMISVAAATVGRLMDNLFALFMYRSHVARLSGATSQELTDIYSEGMMLTAVAVTPVALIMLRGHWSEHSSLILLAPAVALGGCLWAACLWYRKHPLMDEFYVLKAAFLRRVKREVIGES